MTTTTYSLHHISDPDCYGFSAADYSRFKFGDGAVARRFGRELAEGFIRTHLTGLPSGTQLVVVPSPYSFIPTATFAMKDHFMATLNRWLAHHGQPVAQETKVHRTITYKDDYGALNAEERLRLIGNDRFHIDKAFLEGKTVLFLDDIRITGSHERMIRKMVQEYDLTNDMYMLYFAELVNGDIHPNIENHLNYFFVKSIFNLQEIVQHEQFVFNTRLVKYMLNYEHEAFLIFIQEQKDSFISELYDRAIGNGYHTIEAYQHNLRVIKEYLSNNELKQVHYGH